MSLELEALVRVPAIRERVVLPTVHRRTRTQVFPDAATEQQPLTHGVGAAYVQEVLAVWGRRDHRRTSFALRRVSEPWATPGLEHGEAAENVQPRRKPVLHPWFNVGT